VVNEISSSANWPRRGSSGHQRRSHALSRRSRAQDAGPAIRALRQQADGIAGKPWEQAQRMLAAGKSTDEVIEYLANTLTIAAARPTQALRQASELADLTLAETVTRLLTEERDRH